MKSTLKKFLAVITTVVMLIVCTVSVSADTNKALWTAVPLTSTAQAAAGIEGGEGCQWPLFITFSETNSNIAYLGIDVGGIYRSTDGGKSWAHSSIGLGSEGATGLVVDPNNGNRVLVCGVNSTTDSHNGLYLSEDAGITWSPVNYLSSVCGHRDIRDSIAFDKSSYSSSIGGSAIAYWLTEAGALYKSTNGGKNWNQIASSGTYANGEIFVHPTKGYVYLACSNGFYRSTNGGSSFERKLSTAITGIDVINNYPNNVYLSSANGLHISTDSGNSFSNSKGNNYPSCAHRIEVSPADPNYMVVSNDQYKVNGWYSNTIYYSHDGGKNWSTASRDTSDSIIPYNVRSEVLSWHPTDKNVCISIGGDMVMRSTDGGKNFKWSNSGYNGAAVTSISYNVNNPSLMYAGNQDYSGFYSVDSGKTWKYISWFEGWGGFTYGGYAVDNNTVVTINRVNNVYYIYYTTDGGKTVHNTGVNVGGKGYSSVTGMPGDNNIVFANGYRSTNKGVSWSRMDGCDAVLDSNPNNGYLYGVNSSGRLVISTNKGVTWRTFSNYSNGVTDMEYDVVSDRLVVINNYAAYGVSCSNGNVTTIKDFSSMRDGFNQGLILRCVEVDPQNSNRIYVGNARHIFASDIGVLMTENGGANWTNLTSTRDKIYPGADGGREVGILLINPDTRTIFASGMCRGIYKTTTEDTILYAKWEKHDDEPQGTDTHNCPSLAFDDLDITQWYHLDTDYVIENGIFKGVTENEFAPNDKLTRAMLVTVLYRVESEPATNRSIPFADIDMGAYYANAVVWAQQHGIVKGVSETEFAPNDNITREQIAAIMHRYAQYKGIDVSVGENTNILSYDDFADISEYAIASMQYAVGSGLIKGKTESTLNPKDNATRAEIAAILHRFIEANK